jgi:ADP-ribose pyrophosphatase
MSLGDCCEGAAGDAHLREDSLESLQVYRGAFLDVRCDQVRLPDGKVAQRWDNVIHPGAVRAAAARRTLLMERRWRYPMGRAMLEFPAAARPASRCSIARSAS